MRVADWLDELGLGEYTRLFEENAISADLLADLSADDLKELGIVKLGHRKKILAAIAEFKPSGAKPTPRGADGRPTFWTEGERRQVTVLFADLAGYTELSGRLDAEETHRLLNAFFAAVDGIISSYGGRVDKHIGDSVMAVFGAPVAHSDDPERTIRAALDIHRAMPELVKTLGQGLSVHIGIASGQVVASETGSAAHHEYTVTGESVNLASRLSDLARAGETLVSGAHYNAVAHLIYGEGLGETEVEGLARRVEVWRVTGLRIQTAPRSLPFVGRNAELGQFTAAVDACVETQRGETIYVRGEPGIGKTRLVEVFQTIAESKGFERHKGLVLDFGVGKGQDAVGLIVRSLLALPPAAGTQERQQFGETAIQNKALAPEGRVFIYDLLDVPHPPDQRALFDAMDNAERNRGRRETIAALIRHAARNAPLLIVIEDLHWASPSTILDAAAIAATTRQSPTLLVMTSRIEGDPIAQGQTWRAAAQGAPLMRIDLAPLHEDEAKHLAAKIINVNTQFAESCIERAEGNPLFLEQLLRSAEESAQNRVPGSIQSIVLARMDSLEALDREAIQAASVVGQRFSLDLLRHLIESPHYACAGLIDHCLARPEGNDFLFAHALIQEGVYASLLGPRLRDLHLKAAAWYASRDLGLRAEHLDRAGDATAPMAYAEAARALAAQLHLERALELVDRGLALANTSDERYALLVQQGELLQESGHPADSVSSYQAALEVAADDRGRCRAWIGLAAGKRVTDDYEGALAALDKAQSAAQAQGLEQELSQVHYYRGNLYFPLGKVEECRHEHQQAFDRARSAGSFEDEARALSGLGDAYYSMGRMLTALEHFQQCIDLCRLHGFARIETGNQYMIAWTRMYRNEIEESLEDGLDSIRAAHRVRYKRAEMVAHLTAARTCVELAEFDDVEHHVAQGLALVESLGANRFKPFFVIFLTRARLAKRGFQPETVSMVRDALEVAQETGIHFIGPWVNSTLALSAIDRDESEGALAQGERLLANRCVGHNYFAFYCDAMEVALRHQAWDAVDRYARALQEYMTPEPLPLCEFQIKRAKTLARAAGQGIPPQLRQELLDLEREARSKRLLNALPEIVLALEGSA
jgi:class 3 adenylate cyclase/tetratricopeptide (TPR) repeat protein